jgi:phenylacetic acid degradation operon negative regulatory protein
MVVAATTVPIPTRVLVLGMAHDDGSIRADEVYAVAEACGQSAEQVRSCLRRLVNDGAYERDGAGRQAIYRTTESGTAEMGTRMSRTRLAYAQDAAGRGWDRNWRLVAFAVPELRRAARDGFRDRLVRLGGAAIQGGLYVSPHLWVDDVRREASRLGLEEHLTLATTDDLEVAGERDPRRLAAMLWPLDDVAVRYEKFVAAHAHVVEDLESMRAARGRLTDADFLPLALSMAVAYDECARIDPYLPPELLPRPWPGRAARELIVRSRRLALLLRDSHRPALFGLYDSMLASLSVAQPST